MKKITIIGLLGSLLFAVIFLWTGSWWLTLIFVGLMSLYLLWFMVFDLQLLSSKEERKSKEAALYERAKGELERTTRNNPTLR